MSVRLRLILAIIIGLLVSGCSDDWGVDQHARKVTAGELEGQWLLINYWAEWCGPCRKEIPELNRLAQHPQAAVQVLGVNYDGVQGEALARQTQALGIEFRVLAENPAERLQLPRSQALPVTFIVDPQGRLRKQLVGEQTEQGLLGVLAELREQP